MTTAELAAHIEPININGLKGRMLFLPAPKNKKREILYVYGHHSSLERWAGFADDLNQYGAVTVPDLPGFGGMDSFYKIGMKPTLDNLADYLASFIKMRYKRKKITLCGLSFGFIVITRMLQRYPELNDKVEILVSVVGFSHKDDFSFSKKRYWGYRILASIFKLKYPAVIFKGLALHPMVIRRFYSKTHNAKKKFAELKTEDVERATEMEISLWRNNEVCTYMHTTVAMLTLDNCKVIVPRKLYHVSVAADRYFNNNVVEQHLNIIFDEVEDIRAVVSNHAPTVIADKEATKDIIPIKLRRLLAKRPS
ncbi:MAG: alpha/beta hydrolase [bacterium]|nr:alpha/beta hydrolase [bacterium]